MARYPSDNLNWLPFENADGANTIPANGVFRVIGDLDGDDLIFNGYSLGSGGTYSGYSPVAPQWFAVNGPSDVAVGKRGKFLVSGLVVALYSGSFSTDDGFGYDTGSAAALKAGYPGGFQAIKEISSTLGYFWLNPMQSMIGVTTGARAADTLSSSDYAVYQGAPGSEADAGYSTFPPAFNGEAIPDATRIAISWGGYRWELTPLKCS